MLPAHTLTISISRPAADVYAYLAQPARFPEWSKFITGMRPDGDEWIATTTAGETRVRFTPPNTFGIVDHTVTVSPDVEVFVPFRVVPNQAGSEVLFTVFRQSTQDDRDFADDCALVATDLTNLKNVLERS